MMQEKSPYTSPSFKDILFTPVGCLIGASPFLLGVVIVIIVALGLFIFTGSSINLFGNGAPDFKAYIFSSTSERIDGPDHSHWMISYEYTRTSTFTGLVRHTSPIHENKFPFLTHDILITTGDFADSNLVNTQVSNHHFYWQSPKNNSPSGSINLLHTVVRDPAIYDQLLQIKSGQRVSILGTEILRIDYFTPSNELKVWWQDSGCNTLIVQQVTILQ